MSEPDVSQRGLNILCIDNGGMRGLSALFLIQEVMERVQKFEGLESTPEPYKYFDLIAGTGTGAIIACMLGRLCMPIHSAIESYTNLVKDILSERTGNESRPFETSKLKKALRMITQSITGNPDELMMEWHPKERQCKTLVFATIHDGQETSYNPPITFRSYPTPGGEGPNCPIWEVLCATMAYPGLFGSFEINNSPLVHSFVGGLGSNNPITHALSEAGLLYPKQDISAILNIGTGHTRTLKIPGADVSGSRLRPFLPAAAIVAMKEIATDSETIAGSMNRLLRSINRVYFRLNVSLGSQSVEMDQWESPSEVATHTRAYIMLADVNERINGAAHSIKRGRDLLGIQIGVEQTNVYSPSRSCPAPTPTFTGRDTEMNYLERCVSKKGVERVVCIVHGLGGVGKTQLVLKVIERTYNIWKEVIYIDASTKDSIESTLGDIALARGVGNSYKDTLRWLESYRELWLFVLDGANDPSLAFHNYLPSGDYGSVIVTTRLVNTVTLAEGPDSVYNLSSMSPEDAMALLLKLSGRQKEELSLQECENAKRLLKELGHLTLGIVQTGAILRQSPDMSITKYRSLFLASPQRTLEVYNILPTKTGNYGRTVFTTWVDCYQLLGRQSRRLLWLIAFLYHSEISSDIFRKAAMGLKSDKYPPLSRLAFRKRPASQKELVQAKLQKALYAPIHHWGLDSDSDSDSDFMSHRYLDWNETAFSEAINELVSCSLLQYNQISQTYTIHILVQAWARTVIPFSFDLAVYCARILLAAAIPLDHSSESINWRKKLALHVCYTRYTDSETLRGGYEEEFEAVYSDMRLRGTLEEIQEQVRDTSVHIPGQSYFETLRAEQELVKIYSKLGRHDEARVAEVEPGHEERSRGSEPTQLNPEHMSGKMGVGDSGLNDGSSTSGLGGSQDSSDKAGKEQHAQDRHPGGSPQVPLKPELGSRKSTIKRGLNILCFDGGGIRGLSSLLILRETMHRLCSLEGRGSPEELVKPSDWFDIIAGTGTGGVSACMLGRLGMSVETAIETHITLTEAVFSNKKWTGEQLYKSESLKSSLQTIVQNAIGDKDEKIVEDTSQSDGCHTLFFAMSKHNMSASIPVIFRSYQARANPAPNCTIWEALYATMAHPDLFKSIDITENSLKYTFVGGELGSSNPLTHVLAEVRELYPGRHVSCIISIGAGYARTIRIPDCTRHRAYLAHGMAMKSMAVDSERVAEDMTRRFQDTNGVYFRFNVDQGIQDVEADDWESLSNVTAHTCAYMGKNEIDRRLNEATKAIQERRAALAVEYIDGRIQPALVPVPLKSCPVPTAIFTGWDDKIQEIRNCIVEGTKEQRICVIHGLGGSGKTQLALKVIEVNHEHWNHIIFVDAASRQKIEDTLRDFARANNLGSTHTRTLQFLQGTHDRWLLVLDNADDPLLNTLDYIPRCSHGSILITTRLAGMTFYARPPTSVFPISRMNSEEAVSLLLKVVNIRAPRGLEIDTDRQAAEALVRDFGYLALAIVHAGAYIAQSHGTSILEYHALFLRNRKAMLDKYSTLRFRIDDYKKTVYTTWNMCYELLERNGQAQQLLWLMAFLHCNDITRNLFRRAATRIEYYKPILQPAEVEEDARVYLRKYLSSFQDTDESWADQRFVETISELAEYSLVEYDKKNEAYAIHVLVQDWACTIIPEKLVNALERTTSLLSISIGADSDDDPTSHQFRLGLIQHVNKILSEKASRGGVSANHGACFAHVFKSTEQWHKEEPLRVEVKAAREKELGVDHPITLRSVDDLAHNYKNQGRFDMAERLYEEVFQIRKRNDEDHKDTQASRKFLASLYQDRGRYSEAIPLLLDVIKVQRIMKGGNDPETLACMGNLADAYQKSMRLDEAKDLRKQIINLLPDKDPEKPVCMRKLAEVLESEGEWGTAEELLIQSAKDLDRIYGERHRNATAGWIYLHDFRVRKHSVPPISYASCSLPVEVICLCPNSKYVCKLLAFAFRSLPPSFVILVIAYLLPICFSYGSFRQESRVASHSQ
ncbi:unnamed protein product [Rhizoctonia solani]|uniref:PNPLA domain-containing protein n=1 Tax=Rhizoctonia solani TaxID=456999 RepID=A0A8H3B4A4_9AGAM|nr:unnamed protein product [Rhizoctonia solani]